MLNMPKGPFCQSCGLPLESEDLFGTEENGTKSQEYCTYCYQNGSFTAPDITLAEMKEKVAGILIDKKGMASMQAKMLANMFIPQLKRWK